MTSAQSKSTDHGGVKLAFGAQPPMPPKGKGSSNHDIPVSIVGYSLRAPNCSSVAEFAEALKNGQDLTTSNTRYPAGLHGLPPRQGRLKDEDLSEMNPVFFGMSRKLAEKMDPAIRLLLKVSYEAILDAQIDLKELRGSETGVYAGHCFCDISSGLKPTEEQRSLAAGTQLELTGYEVLATAHCMAANRLSYFYDLKGPSMALDTACSSSLLALDRAVKDIKAGIIDRALVCGISLTLDHCKNAVLTKAQMLSPTGHCHVFDKRADGYCRADGIGCVILERGESGYAMVLGSGTNQDGATGGITYPNPEQQYDLMTHVFASSGVDPATVVYHESHGTGTVVGDKEELAALSKLYKDKTLVIGSVKSNMGHSEGASGLMGLAKILLMYEDKLIYPNHDFQESCHDIIKSGQFSVLKEAKGWEPGVATLSNFGFGGSNAFAIFKPCLQRKCIPSLLSLVGTPFLSSPGDPPSGDQYADFYAIQRAIGNSKSFRYEWKAGEWQTGDSPLVFVCDGQGSQWNNMGQDLMQESNVFRATIERLDQQTGVPLVQLYEDGTKWTQKEFSAIGIISFQLAMIAVLADQNIHPDFFLGHSVGEMTCPFLAGFLSEAEVLLATKVRSDMAMLVDKACRLDIYADVPSSGYDFTLVLPSGEENYAKKVSMEAPLEDNVIETFSMMGRMVVVGCAAEVVEDAINELNLRQTCVACLNAPQGQTVSGAKEEVDALLQHLIKKVPGLFYRELDTDGIAYHAPYIKVFREHLRAKFQQLKDQPLPESWKSTSRQQIFGVQYFLNNICNPVYFQEAIEALPSNATIIEIGPSSGLLAQIRRTRKSLTLKSLVEREKSFDLVQTLHSLKPWRRAKIDEGAPSKPTGKTVLHYSERYPEIWGKHTQFPLPTFANFERFYREFTTVKEVVYDLQQAPWSSIRDHTLRGQCLFPAAGFLHILWSVKDFQKNTEVKDFKIVAPFVIPKKMQQVRFLLHRTGQYCEIWDSNNETCHASGQVQTRDIHGTRSGFDIDLSSDSRNISVDDCYDSKYWYSSSSSFGPRYRNLEKISVSFATIKHEVPDFIAYIDAFFQQLGVAERIIPDFATKVPDGDRLYLDTTSQAISFPKGVDRVVFWETNLDAADRWIKVRKPNSVAGNRSLLIEGLHKEFARIQPRYLRRYAEKFVEYSDSNENLPPFIIAGVLLRESIRFRVVEPIESDDLQAVVTEMRNYPLSKCSDDNNEIVFSDSLVEEASLLVTTKSNISSNLVARWGSVHLYRVARNTSLSSLQVISDWQDVPAVESAKSFVWKGDGSSGAVASICIEMDRQPISYSGSTDHLVGLEKGMRQNFLLEAEDGQVRHGVWIDVEQEDTALLKKAYAVQLQIAKPGVLDSLEWAAIDPEHHSVSVSTATINFRDIMRAMGMLKEQYISLGFEFSGFHTVDKRRVFGLGINCLATHCHPAYCYPTPSHLSDDEAATIPLVYLTCFCAFEKSKAQKGQSILIHAGTGGVGMAAITVALKRGLHVFTTCSSPKRQILKDKFGLKDEQIGDSRSDAFVETVLEGTLGRGVDIVLNQLAGPLQVASLRCLAPGGQFCEIGKYDVFINSRVGQALFEENITFHVIDLLHLSFDETFKSMCDEWLDEGFKNSEIVPLPTTVFEADEIVSAFRFMSQGRHTGKIVIKGLGATQFQVRHLPFKFWKEMHLITGGVLRLYGASLQGLALAYRLACHGTRHLVLVGRRGVTDPWQRNMLSQIVKLGCHVEVVASSLLDLASDMAAPTRIWHVATVYAEALFENMTEEQWDMVATTKVDGFLHLRECWPGVPIVNISSVSGYFGALGLTSYAYANSKLDAVSRLDPNAIAIRLGPVDNVGYVVKEDSNRLALTRSPFELMAVSEVLTRIEEIVSENETGVFALYNLKPRELKRSLASNTGPFTLQDAQNLLVNVLGGQADQYYPSLALRDTGLDSLSLVEVLHQVMEETGEQDFKPQDIDDRFTVQDLVAKVNDLRSKHQRQQGVTDGNQTLDTTPETNAASVPERNSSSSSIDKEATETESTTVTDPTESRTVKEVERMTTMESDEVDQMEGKYVWFTKERNLLGLVTMITALWWLIAWLAFGIEEVSGWMVIANASFVFNCCFMINFALIWSIKNLGIPVRDSLSCAHFIQGFLSCIAWIFLYAVDFELYVKYWESIMFGFYSFDAISIVLNWESLVPEYRRFTLVHHPCTFFGTGVWKVFPYQRWDTYVALGVMLWLTATMWLDSVMLYRHFMATTRYYKRELLPFLIAIAFCLERLQRVVVFVVVAALSDIDLYSSTSLAMLWTGIVMEAWAIYYQQMVVRKHFLIWKRAREFARTTPDLEIPGAVDEVLPELEEELMAKPFPELKAELSDGLPDFAVIKQRLTDDTEGIV